MSGDSKRRWDAGGLARSSAWNVVGFAATIGAHFITVPTVIARMGLAEFGRAGLVIAVWAPFLLVGSVIGQAVLREVAARRAEFDERGAARVAWAAITMAVIAAAAVSISIALLGPFIASRITGIQSSRESWGPAFIVFGVGWFAQQLTLTFQGIAAADQDYRTIAAVTVLSAAVTVVAVIAFVHAQPRIEYYLAGLSAGFVAGAVAWPVLLRGAWRSERWADVSTERRALLHFGRWQAVTHVTAALANQIDRYMLGALAAPQVLGQFNAANRLQEAAYAGVSKTTEVLFPYFGRLGRAKSAQNIDIVLVSSWVVAVLSAAVLGPMVPLANALLTTWAGDQIGRIGGFMLQILVLGGLIGSGTNVVTFYFLAAGRTGRVAALSSLYSATTIVLTVILFRVFGPYAAGGGALIAAVIRLIAILAQFRRHAESTPAWGDLVVSTAMPIAAGAAVAAALGGIVPIRSATWPELGVIYAIAMIGFVIFLVALTAVFPRGRRLLKLAYSAVSRMA